MVKIRPIGEKNKSSKYFKILEQYFEIIPPEKFFDWHKYVFNQELTLPIRKERYISIISDINALKKLFKQRTIELNRKIQREGFANYLEARLIWDKIPKRDYQEFLKNVDQFASLIHADIPSTVLVKKEKNWNIYNTPYPLGLRIPDDNFELPDEVLHIVSKYDKRLSKYKERIDIKLEDDEFYPYTYYNKNSRVAEIKLSKQRREDVYQSLAFVHELGHALDMLEKADEGKDPHALPNYWGEYKANEFMHRFIRTSISEEHQKVIRYNWLQMIAATLFEIDIFTNDKQDYDKTYAKAINRCYPMTQQRENPFYVLYGRFILHPLGELMSSMIETELYLKEANLSKN